MEAVQNEVTEVMKWHQQEIVDVNVKRVEHPTIPLREDHDLLDDLKDLPKDFRLRQKKYLLTYKYHIPKEEMKKRIKEVGAVVYVFVCHESGHDEKTPYNHTHVLVEFRKALSIQGKNAARTFDLDQTFLCKSDMNSVMMWQTFIPAFTEFETGCIHPNIKVVQSNLHERMCKLYIGKEDQETYKEVREKFPEIDVEVVSVVERVMGAKTKRELLQGITKFNEVTGAITAWNELNGGEREITPPELVYSWQHQLLEMMENGDPTLFTRRSIVWICDFVGGTGKSDAVSNIVLKYSDKWAYRRGAGQQKDWSEYFKGCIERGWSGEGLFLDLPRDCCRKQFYEMIECYKDNRCTTEKWNGQPLWFSRNGCVGGGNKIIVMANFWPQIYGKCSIDRWRLFEAVKNENDITLEKRDPRIIARMNGESDGEGNMGVYHGGMTWSNLNQPIQEGNVFGFNGMQVPSGFAPPIVEWNGNGVRIERVPFGVPNPSEFGRTGFPQTSYEPL